MGDWFKHQHNDYMMSHGYTYGAREKLGAGPRLTEGRGGKPPVGRGGAAGPVGNGGKAVGSEKLGRGRREKLGTGRREKLGNAGTSGSSSAWGAADTRL
jgi:hypothetical protein